MVMVVFFWQSYCEDSVWQLHSAQYIPEMMSVSKHWCLYSKSRIIFMCTKCRKKFGSKACVSSYTYNIKIFKHKINKLSKMKKKLSL